ncbi:MAG: hypothetical protein KKC30_05815 [Proteobacteria bacterium]|nr:hypothetical protein [Pseudomonadota bacterium]MBU4276240.1 hypothetical protein [Pseudomonadota bacterium]MBU4384352.1 hypothetical protein [Pseudomonadota bacterium]MBU4604070.1 hypothetical protein [Pseudomonadota bacterium]MCG2764170.1 hypothetical protein [Desulfarculaceae bacterium]
MFRCIIVLVLLLAGGLAGCHTTSDPAKGGFFDYFVHRDDYDRRQVQRKQELAQAQAQNAGLQRQGTALEKQMAQEQQKLDALQARMEVTSAELDKMRRDIQQGKVKNRKARQEVEALLQRRGRLEAKLQSLRNQQNLSVPALQAQIDQLQKEIAELEEEVLARTGL